MVPKTKILSCREASDILRGIGWDIVQKRLKKESDIFRKIISNVKKAIRQNKLFFETPSVPKKVYIDLKYYDAFTHFKSVEIVDSQTIGDGQEMVIIKITF